MIIVIGDARATPQGRGEALRLSLEHVQRSRKEAGCISHNVSVDAEDDCRLVFVEYWQDMPALKTHFGLADSKGFIAALSPLLAARPNMKIYPADEIQPG